MLQMNLFGEVEEVTQPTTTTKPKKIATSHKIGNSLELKDRIPDGVLFQLQVAEIRHGVVILTPELPRDIYEGCDEVLRRLRGAWDRRAGGHVFPFEPEVTEALFKAVVASGLAPAKNPFALFPTPLAVIEELVDYNIAERLDWWQENREKYQLRQLRMLEPSAGIGAIASYVRERWPDLEITLVEIDEINVGILHELGFDDVHHADFAKWKPSHDYDVIAMNPPFAVGGKDCYQDHVCKAHSHLRKDGLLAAVAPPGWQWKNDSTNLAFLNFVASHGHWWELPKQSFKESGTTIDTYGILLDYEPSTDRGRYEEFNGYRNFDEWLLKLHCNCDSEYYNWEWRLLEKIRSGQIERDFIGLPRSESVLNQWRTKVEDVRRRANRAGDGFVLANLDIDRMIVESISNHLSDCSIGEEENEIHRC